MSHEQRDTRRHSTPMPWWATVVASLCFTFAFVAMLSGGGTAVLPLVAVGALFLFGGLILKELRSRR